MLSYRLLTSSLLLLCYSLFACEDEPKTEIYIAKYPEDKPAAVSFTFDDACPSTFTAIVPVLNKFSVKATFFIVPALIPESDWPKWKALVDQGFELGNHTQTHRDLTTLQPTEVIDEVNEAKSVIIERTGCSLVSFAAPGHRTNPAIDAVVFKNHEFIRRGVYGWVAKTTANSVIDDLVKAKRSGKWFIGAAHGIGDCWEPIRISTLEKTLKFVTEHETDYAVGTFEELARYEKIRNGATLIVTRGENFRKIELTSRLNSKGCLLTIVIRNPDFPSSARFTSAGEVLDVKRVGDRILISVPKESSIDITW